MCECSSSFNPAVGMGGLVNDIESILQTAGQVYTNIRPPQISLPTWGSGQVTTGTWSEQFPQSGESWFPQYETNWIMPALVLGGLYWLLKK